MTDAFAISVVIPTYQRCVSLRRSLEALARQSLPPSDYEVIVPIDGSTDGTQEMIERFRAAYRLRSVWQPNQGRAAARNAGVRLAEGRLIVFLDDDMEPVPGFLRAHQAAHPPGSRRAVVGPVPIADDRSAPPVVQYRRAGIEAHLNRLAQPGYRLGFRDVYTGNLSLRRDVLQEVGGLDESFRLYGHEDYELALRLMKAGVELAYCPQAVAHQHYDKDLAGLARDCVARGHTAVLFARKHPEIAASLKLATYGEGSRKWRLTRALMLGISGWIPSFPDRLIGWLSWLDRRPPRRLHQYYTLALDYFFWLGARQALRERPEAGGSEPSQPAGSPHRAGDRGGSARRRGVRIGLVVLVLFAWLSSVRLLRRAVGDFTGAPRPDEITRYEARFRGLRELLPPRVRVGYVTQPLTPAAGPDSARLAFKRYLLTQYALLPAIVLPDKGGRLVVGNFDEANPIDSTATRGLTPIRDFGNGVMLFRAAPE